MKSKIGNQGKAFDKYHWPFGNLKKPDSEAICKSQIMSMQNVIIALYLWMIEKDGAVFETDSRMMPDAGPCLQLLWTIKRMRFDLRSCRFTMAQLSGAVHSIIHGYFHVVSNKKEDYFRGSKTRSGCHLCLEPRCIRHVMMAAQSVNVANEKCHRVMSTVHAMSRQITTVDANVNSQQGTNEFYD